MKKRFCFILSILLALVSCKSLDVPESRVPSSPDKEVVLEREAVDRKIYNTDSVLVELTIEADNFILEAILFDNATAQMVAAMLPITVDTWHPAPHFARAFNLPNGFTYFDQEPPQRGYELGSLAYWMPGPSIAMIYEESRNQTVVPVVPIGKIISDVSPLATYEGVITIKIKGEK